MSLTIGELAQRLRVSTRTLRHYDHLGLLVPEQVDPRTRHRRYGRAQLLRGVQIEQLKATGLALSAIKDVAEHDIEATRALRHRRREIAGLVADHTAQLRAIDALLAYKGELANPEVVEVPGSNVVTTQATCEPNELSRTIRRTIQRLGRETRRRSGIRCRSFSASFPLHVGDGPTPVEVVGHLDEATDNSITEPAHTQLRVRLVGNIALLPLAYDVALPRSVSSASNHVARSSRTTSTSQPSVAPKLPFLSVLSSRLQIQEGPVTRRRRQRSQRVLRHCSDAPYFGGQWGQSLEGGQNAVVFTYRHTDGQSTKVDALGVADH